VAHPKCPHCSEEITTPLTGFVAESTLRERLKGQATAKDAEIAVLSARVTELDGKTTGYDAIVAERDKLKAEAEGAKKRGERTAKLAELKLKPELLDHVEVLYNSAQAGAEAPKEFAAWLAEDAKAHPLLAPHFGAVTTTPVTTTTTTTPANKLPVTPPGGDPPGPGGKMTPDQVRAYFASPEYQALDRKAKVAKIAELKGHVPEPGATATG
jgi:hypothetical protein